MLFRNNTKILNIFRKNNTRTLDYFRKNNTQTLINLFFTTKATNSG